MKRVAHIVVVTVLLAQVLFPVSAEACLACIEDRLLAADLVVVGKLRDAEGGFRDPPEKGIQYALHVIDVKEVLRGDRNAKSVSLAHPVLANTRGTSGRKPPGLSKDPNAVWVLKKDLKHHMVNIQNSFKTIL